MTSCTYHPSHNAIESCEVCGDGLCGLCLWYTDDGHRLCEKHARERQAAGQTVISPETYQEAIPGTISLKTEGTFTPDRDGIYRGNQTDLSALIAAMLSLTTLASCFGGIYCMPILALILGAIAYRNANIAIDGQRTKVLSIVGMTAGGLFVLMIGCFVLMYVGMIIFAVTASSTTVP